MLDRQAHWEAIYREKDPTEVSWYQADPARSLALIEAAGIGRQEPILDVGGGASLLVDRLLARGYSDLTVLDVSAAALERVRERLGSRAAPLALEQADVTTFRPARSYALWHDRAVFHFLTDPANRSAYRRALREALPRGAHAIVATFALDGPPKCSGLEVARYDATGLATELGPRLELVRAEREAHLTPAGRMQHFLYCWFRVAS